MNIKHWNSATAEASDRGVRTPSRAFNRRVRAMRAQELESADYAAPMDEILRDQERQCEVESRLSDGREMSLIYTGGNETQTRYGEGISERLAKEWPEVEVEFHFPGWGSQRASPLETLEPRIESADAVVLSYLVRTNCSRHVRKMCDRDTPWFACTGKGRKSIEGSLRQAALWAAEG